MVPLEECRFGAGEAPLMADLPDSLENPTWSTEYFRPFHPPTSQHAQHWIERQGPVSPFVAGLVRSNPLLGSTLILGEVTISERLLVDAPLPSLGPAAWPLPVTCKSAPSARSAPGD